MSTLYVIPTPIGNLKDITYRAVEVLKSLDVILSEDTRVTAKLLRLLEIDYKGKKLVSFFEHSEKKRIPEVLSALNDGFDLGLVTDAGTPVLSDPGYKLLREIRKAGHKIDVLPGATSITTALVASTLPPDKFMYLGYLPRKTGEITKFLSFISKADIKCTYIAFESPHRIVKTLELMHSIFEDKVQVAVCKELTKLHESVDLGTPLELIELFKEDKYLKKGEIVICFNLE